MGSIESYQLIMPEPIGFIHFPKCIFVESSWDTSEHIFSWDMASPRAKFLQVEEKEQRGEMKTKGHITRKLSRLPQINYQAFFGNICSTSFETP